MSIEDNLCSLKKNNSGDIILEIKFENLSFKNLIKTFIKTFLSIIVKVFLPIFKFFDFLASKKKLVISAVGFGIGLGLSVIVTQRPDVLQAFPSFNNEMSQNIWVSSLSVPSIDLYSKVSQGNIQDLLDNVAVDTLIHDLRFGELGSHNVVVVADVGVQNILKNLESVKIGDQIVVKGSNDAEYKYSVTEIRDMKSELLPNVIAVNSDVLVLYKSKNLFRTRVYLVIAKLMK